MTRTLPEALVDTALARGLRAGTLTLVGRDGRERRFEGELPGPAALVELKTAGAARRTVAGGALGVAEAYMDGAWDSPSLDAVLELGVANMEPAPTKTTLLTPLARAWHAMRDNDVAGSRKNIAHHYDLGNDFYRIWLDPTMTYSCALFVDGDDDLHAAQVRKWDRLLALLEPGPKDHVLEIGCGWGGFAIHAARQTGCKVTGLTLSEEQAAWARNAVREADLEGLVDVRLQDYRHVPERFTRIASIEMFEAVGEEYWGDYFRTLHRVLTPGGRAGLQIITIRDDLFEGYRRRPDFIQKYVFPGGMLPSEPRLAPVIAVAGLDWEATERFGQDYAATLDQWGHRFDAAWPAIAAGARFDERFRRLWRFYLAYCEAGFRSGRTDVIQIGLSARDG